MFTRGTCRETASTSYTTITLPSPTASLIGFELQRAESDILVAVLLTCFKRGIIVLPIHDAVLCPASPADDVEAVMLDTFKKLTGGASGSVSRAWTCRTIT